MYLLEFKEVTKIVDINSKKVKIGFGGPSYAVVKGNIPLEVANIIFEKYPGNPYGIRVNGGSSSWNPNDKTIKSYHIDTKEGLIIFITEFNDYLRRQQNLEETEVQRYDEILAKVNEGLLKKIKPNMSAYEWMDMDEECREEFFDTVFKNYNTVEGMKEGMNLRNAINSFDAAVNPFLNDKIELMDASDFSKKVEIRGDVSHNDSNKRDYYTLQIRDLDSKDQTAYYRTEDGFSIQLQYELSKDHYVSVVHYYSKSPERENGKGETIQIYYYGNNATKEFDISYNLTTGVVRTRHTKTCPATLEQIELILNEIKKATSLATVITVNNMAKKNNQKIFLPKDSN